VLSKRGQGNESVTLTVPGQRIQTGPGALSRTVTSVSVRVGDAWYALRYGPPYGRRGVPD